MKTAVSIPDDVFAEAEALANRTKRPRSEIYARALVEYVARHAPDRVTESMDRVLDQVDERPDEFQRLTARRTLGRTEW